MLKKIKVDRYFLTEQCPFSKKRKIKPKAVWTTLGALTACFVFSVLFFGSTAERNGATQAASQTSSPATPNTDSNRGADGDSFWYSRARSEKRSSNRQYNASQLVRRQGSASGDKMPMGSTIPVRLVNQVISSDNGAPVIAEVTEEVLWKNSAVIPAGTRALGSASFDDTAKRLQMRFQTLVFPEGEQHSVSGLALMPDGSSGLPGDYHSGQFSAQAGRFLGYFVGGLTSGMKDKTSQGQFGLPYEPGSLKNGLLNGLSQSATDQANQASESMKNTHPYLEVSAGVPFFLYLEKEFP